MTDRLTILNDRDLKRAKARLAKLEDFSYQPSLFNALADGKPPAIAAAHLSNVKAEIENLKRQAERYEHLLGSDSPENEFRGTNELGLVPIIGRIARGLSQSELADGLGWREQQIQRYESEMYASIKLASFISVLLFLKIDIATIRNIDSNNGISILHQIDATLIKQISQRNWFASDSTGDPRTITRNLRDILQFMDRKDISRSYHRRTKRNSDVATVVPDLIWKAGVIHKAWPSIENIKVRFDFRDITWVSDVIRLSKDDDGPVQAVNFLAEHGVLLVVEPAFSGMNIDGAAFLVDGHPIVALTLRYDRIDNFWFVLLHELGHVFLHHSRGLAAGFFDNFDDKSSDDVEKEADAFALETVFPEIKWKNSSARITEDPQIVKKIANNIGIHEALLFGRIRRERGYNKFSSYIGEGKVRKLFNL